MLIHNLKINQAFSSFSYFYGVILVTLKHLWKRTIHHIISFRTPNVNMSVCQRIKKLQRNGLDVTCLYEGREKCCFIIAINRLCKCTMSLCSDAIIVTGSPQIDKMESDEFHLTPMLPYIRMKQFHWLTACGTLMIQRRVCIIIHTKLFGITNRGC